MVVISLFCTISVTDNMRTHDTVGITVNQTVDQLVSQSVSQASNKSVSQSVRPTTQSLIHNYNNDDDNNKPIYLAQNVTEGTILNAYTLTHTQAPAHTSALTMHKLQQEITHRYPHTQVHTIHKVTTTDNTETHTRKYTHYTKLQQ